MARNRRFLPELESLRGIAVLLVVAFHVDGYIRFGSPSPPSLLASVVHAGHTGVDLFFVLSAFLLSLPFFAAARGGPPATARVFLVRRALRILPLYWLAVVFATLMTSSRASDLLRAVPHLTFLSAFGVSREWQLHPYGDVWWSLVTEIEFYGLLLLLPLALRTRTGRRWGVAALGCYVVAYVAMVTGRLHMPTAESQFTFLFSVFARGPLFLWGITAAWIFDRHGDALRRTFAGNPLLGSGGGDLLFAATLLALALLLRWVDTISPTHETSTYQPWHIANGALWTSVLLLLLIMPLRTKGLVTNAALARLGVLSYSIYIVHAPLIQLGLGAARTHIGGLVGWNMRTAAFAIVAAAACYGVSTLTYRWIERPFLRLKGRFEPTS